MRFDSVSGHFRDRSSRKSSDMACIAIVSNLVKWCFVCSNALWRVKKALCRLKKPVFVPPELSGCNPDMLCSRVPFSNRSKQASMHPSWMTVLYWCSILFDKMTTTKRSSTDTDGTTFCCNFSFDRPVLIRSIRSRKNHSCSWIMGHWIFDKSYACPILLSRKERTSCP